MKLSEPGKLMGFMIRANASRSIWGAHARRVCSPYIELHACSAFSFLRGGSLPEVSNVCTRRTQRSLRQAAANNRLAACAPQSSADCARVLIDAFGRDNVFVEIQRHFIRREECVNRELIDLARANRLPILATNGVQYAKP